MAAKAAMTLSFKKDILDGLHLAGHDYKIALFLNAAHDANTTAYGATSEISGTGYSAGGISLTGRSVTTVSSASLSITGITRSGTTATATTAAANHGLQVGEIVTVSGATQTDYNITATITSVPALNQFTYEVENAPATPATGTIVYLYKEIIIDFNDPVWASATITADSALIYNNTLGGKNSVAVLKFASSSSTNGNFTVVLPAPTVGVGALRVN
jgi:hypothetical protein